MHDDILLKEACEAIMNDDGFGELESDNSCYEVYSNPDNDCCGRNIAVETPTPSPLPRLNKILVIIEPYSN